jgi:hypothetical protein
MPFFEVTFCERALRRRGEERERSVGFIAVLA